MGLSLRNIGKKIEQDVSGIFGGGQQQPPPRTAIPQAQPRPGGVMPASSQASQGGAFIHPMPPPGINAAPAVAPVQSAQKSAVTGTNLTHNPITNFIGNNIIKPLAQFPIDASSQIYNRAVAPVLGTPQLTPQQTTPIKGVSKAVGATGSLHQTVGSGIQTALTLAAPGVSNIIEGGVARALPEAAAPVVARLAPKVASNAALGAGFNASAAASQGAKPGQIVQAGAAGTAAGLFPVAGAAIRPVVRLAGQGLDRVGAAMDRPVASPAELPPTTKTPVKVQAPEKAGASTPTVTPTEKGTVPVTPAPAGKVATGKVLAPKTSMPEVNAAIKDVSTQYVTPTKFEGDIGNVIKQAQGGSTIGSRAANGLRKALKNNLSEEENRSVSDILDNHPGAKEVATPKAIEVAKALKPLQDQGFGVRQAIDPNINKVQDYVSRLRANTVGAAVDAGTKVLGKIRSLADITNLNSRFSQERQVGKFVDDKGNPVYGNSSELGLTRHQDGTITDGKGNALKQVAVSKRELEANGAGKYEHNISRISGIYHADTASLKVRAEALKHIQDNPEALGLSKTQEPGMVPITRIKELGDYYGKPEDVKALEANFGFKNAAGPAGKTYDALSNVATQFIVLNPFFHGMNQLYQTSIAAGNMPAAGTGWLKVASHVMNVSEQDIRDYLANGGHIPDYGMGIENVLSKVTHGATKINNKAMSAIETKLRTGLYKASVESGMAPKDAVANIDKFLGDSHQVSAATRRFTLFFHYFQTMAKSLGSQIAHPIENKGANINTAALAAITAAVTYGYQQATGNKNAYVRVPGELGLVKEAVQSAVGLAQGDPGKATEVVTNRVNPILKEGLQQTFNKDLFTGGKVTDTAASLPGVPGGRVGHAVSAVVAPAQVVGRAMSGTKSPAETVANQFGLYTQHAKGYQASSKVSFLNTPGAIKGNGVAEQNAYFNGLDKAQQALQGKANSGSLNAFTKYLGRSHDSNTGQSIQNSPAESIQNASALATNNKLRGVVQKFEQSQPSHDPMWDLPDDKLAALMRYKAMYTGSSDKKFDLSQAQNGNDNWITDIQNKQSDYYNNLPHTPGKPPIAVAPPYPKFDTQTQSLMTAYDNASPDQKSTLIQQYGGELSTAWNQVAQWTNQMRKAEGAPELKDYPVADAATQKIMDTYNALPKGNGPKGGSPDRAAWITANPGAYAQMQNYLSSTSMDSLVKNAALDQFKGADASQTLLKDIKNVGQYDIASTKNADGTTSYALNPSAAAAAYASSFSSSSNTADYRAYKDAKTLKYTNKIARISAKIKNPSVKVSKGHAGKARVALKATSGKTAVALKPSKV